MSEKLNIRKLQITYSSVAIVVEVSILSGSIIDMFLCVENNYCTNLRIHQDIIEDFKS